MCSSCPLRTGAGHHAISAPTRTGLGANQQDGSKRLRVAANYVSMSCASRGPEVVAVFARGGVESPAERAVHCFGGAEAAGPGDLLDRAAGGFEQPAG